MNAHDREFCTTAASHAEKGAQAWRAAALVQRSAQADHAEFYALAGELVDTLRAMEQLVGVLVRQVSGYAAGRRLYDDEGGDPAARLASAGEHLTVLSEVLAEAERRAGRFWSAIGHIGVEVDK